MIQNLKITHNSVNEWQRVTAMKEFIRFKEYNVLTQIKTCIFIEERVTLHLNRKFQMKKIHTPLKYGY